LNPKLLDVLEAILGPDIELWKWGQCVYRQPDSGIPKSLHQDEYYFEHKHNSSTGVLSYATDVSLNNSPLYVVPGSHKLGLMEHVDDQWAGFALPDESWWDRAVPVTGRAGDSILFHGATIHGSPANRSDRPRPVFIQRYRRADDYCMIDVVSKQDRDRAEKNPVKNKTSDDWGLMVRGLRRYLPSDSGSS
jgi:ectoine hydroxylase-related dioxygenase (phytanoyl-CoA dioxygenase family)